MKTIDVPDQDDEVLGEVETDEGPMVRVRRPVAFLHPVDARRISTVKSPAVGITFSALKGAVAVHEPPKSEAATWDGDAAVGRLRKWASSDGSGDKEKEDWTKYATGFAFADDSAADFGAFKLPHHDIEDGRLVVVWPGVAAAMAAVRGGRGGVDLPADARAGVERHLAAHYKQFDKPVPGEENQGQGSEEGAVKTASSPTVPQPASSPSTTPPSSAASAPAAVPPAQPSLAARVLASIKQALVGADPALLAEIEAATKSAQPTTTIQQAVTRREVMDEWWRLQDALGEVMNRALYDDDYAGDRKAVVLQAGTDFGQKAAELVARKWPAGAPAAAAKSADGDDPVLAGAEALFTAAKAAAQEAVKAGKVLSAANLERVQAAMRSLQQLIEVALKPAAGTVPGTTEPPVVGEETKKANVPGEPTPSDGTVPGMSSDGPTPEPAAEAEAEQEERKMTENAKKALEALKAATTDEARAKAMADMEAALKATPAAPAAPAAPPGEMEAMKAQVAGLVQAVGDLTDLIAQVAQKAIPGISAPGLSQDPEGKRLGKQMDQADATEEEVLQDGEALFPGDPVPEMFSGGAVTTPANDAVVVNAPAQKMEAEVVALKAQVNMLAGMLRPPSMTGAGHAPGNGSRSGSSWGTGGLVR